MRIPAAALLALLLSVTCSFAALSLGDMDCVVCHPTRDPVVFKRLGERSGVTVSYASAQEVVCRTCHNGTVRDDRARLGPKAFGHPVSMPGTKELAKKFPLYGDSRMECATCHTPHPDGSNALGRPGWLRADPSEPFPCADCHKGHSLGKASHLGVKLTQAMVKAVSARGGRPGKTMEVVCATCHVVHGAAGKSLLIAPYGKEGEKTLCRLCHPAKLEVSTHPSNVVADNVSGDKFPLAENGALTCSTCHPPHGVAGEASLGLRFSKEGNLLCEPCHQSGQRRFFGHLDATVSKEGARTLAAIGGQTTKERKVVCLSCHSAHEATASRLTVAQFIDGKSLGLCYTCHKVREVKDKLATDISQRCTDCHGFHGAPPTAAPDGRDPCLVCHPNRSGSGEHRYAAGKGCEGCHSIHRGDPRDKLLSQPVEGDAACRGCHSPKDYGHATGAAPLGINQKLLDRRGISLDPDHTIGCATCHASHKAGEESLLKVNEEILCLYCHPTQNPFGALGLKPGAHPVGVALSGERAVEAKRGGVKNPTLSEASRADRFGGLYACSTCHRAHRGGRVSDATCEGCHKEVKNTGNHKENGGCLACHPIHAEKSPAVSCELCHIEKEETIHERSVPLTSGALPGVLSGRLVEGGGELACPTCHEPHSATPGKLRAATADKLCLSCHGDKERMLEGTHGTVGKAGAGRRCSTCHPVHAQKRDQRLQGDRCFNCHKRSIRSAGGHTAEGSLGLWGRIERLPLFDSSGRRNSYGFVDCPSCHNLHVGKGEASLRLPTRGIPDLCLSCHQEKRSILGSLHDPSSGKNTGEDAPCDLCHSIHGMGKMPPTWTIAAGALGALNDRKCSPCHGPPDQGPRPHAGPRSHPSNVVLPEGMESKGLKLFGAMGEAGGRLITCSTCHNIHGELSSTEETNPDFLRLRSDDGALCTTCHAREAAVRATGHDLKREAKRELGPCSPCHVAHGGDAIGKLWGVPPFPEGIPQNRRCKSCHSRKAESETPPPRLYQHMRDAEVAINKRKAIILQRPQSLSNETAFRKNETPVIPVFDAKGGETDYGVLACVSCHDPHQWSPENALIKPSPTAKWTVTTSFLKFGNFKQLGPTLCSECHKREPENYFNRYHEIWSDPGIEGP